MSIDFIAQTYQTSRGSIRASRGRTICLATFGLTLLYLFLTPNFQSGEVSRSTPLGSDFLQEWTGAYVWLNHRSELYNPDRFVAVQHDPSLVGFAWPAEQFYPMVYPPFYYMLLSPLSQMPYSLALTLWMLAIGAAIAATLWLWVRYHPGADRHWGKCLVATLAFYPVLMCFNTAHKSALLLLILTAAYLLLQRQKSFSAGLVFGLIAFKPHLGLVIGLAMLAKRQWSFVLGCATTVGILLLLSVAAGWDLCEAYFWQCLSMGDYTSTSGYQLTESHSLIGAVSLIFGTATGVTSQVFRALAVSLMVIVGVGLRGRLDTRSNRFARQFSLLIIATILLSPHFYVYDLAILLLPIGLIVFQITNERSTKKTPEIEQSQLSQSASTARCRHHRLLLGCCMSVFAFAGVSAQIAAAVAFQVTVPLMLIMACTLAWYPAAAKTNC